MIELSIPMEIVAIAGGVFAALAAGMSFFMYKYEYIKNRENDMMLPFLMWPLCCFSCVYFCSSIWDGSPEIERFFHLLMFTGFSCLMAFLILLKEETHD